MPRLACWNCGRQVHATSPLASLFADERRCPRCGVQMNLERRGSSSGACASAARTRRGIRDPRPMPASAAWPSDASVRVAAAPDRRCVSPSSVSA